jgi:AraC-like DNA-binding protein
LKGVLVKNSAIEASHQEDIIAQNAQGNDMNSFFSNDEALAKDLSSTKTNEDVYLPAGKLASLGDQLKVDLLRQRIYLKKGCTTAMLAAEMGVQPYLLSAVINQVFKTNFNDFLNQYRVEHAKNLIGNGQAKMLTLEALSEECGFNNRNSFTMAFKKHTGKTPSEFIKGDFASAP